MLSEWLVSLSDKVISVRSKLCRATGTIGGGKVAFKIAGGRGAYEEKTFAERGRVPRRLAGPGPSAVGPGTGSPGPRGPGPAAI